VRRITVTRRRDGKGRHRAGPSRQAGDHRLCARIRSARCPVRLACILRAIFPRTWQSTVSFDLRPGKRGSEGSHGAAPTGHASVPRGPFGHEDSGATRRRRTAMERLALELDGRRVSYLHAGEGPPVLLLHGTFWSRLWGRMAHGHKACGRRALQGAASRVPNFCNRFCSHIPRLYSSQSRRENPGNVAPAMSCGLYESVWPGAADFMHERGELGDSTYTKEKMRYLALVRGFIGRLR